MGRYLDKFPHPWNVDLIEKALFENFTDAREAIEKTSGGKFWSALSDLQDTLWIFQCASTELLDEISLFSERSQSPAFWSDQGQADFHTKSVKRYIFNCTSSLMALVDHARNFEKSYPVPDYKLTLEKFFNVPGLHNFLQCFRNYNSHWRVAEANWNIRLDFKKGTREAQFSVSKEELLRWTRWEKKSQEFINSATNSIDVREVFLKYRKSVYDFYFWHNGAVLSQYANIYQPYLNYKRIQEGLQKKINWNLFLSHADSSIDPYAHVSKYLTKQQLEAWLALEHRSEAQVDALIDLLGMREFCTTQLRDKTLSLFQVHRTMS